MANLAAAHGSYAQALLCARLIHVRLLSAAGKSIAGRRCDAPSRKGKTMATIESVFNASFAKLLSKVSCQNKGWLSAEQESLIEDSTLRPDMLLDRPGLPPFIVECKFAESAGDPVEDLNAKLGKICSAANKHVAGQVIRSGAALRYPKGSKNWTDENMEKHFLNNKAELEWKLATLSGESVEVFPEKGWITGDIYDFWASISRTALNTEETEKLGKAVTDLLKSAAKNMMAKLENHTETQKRISVMMGEPEDYQAGMEIACVVWLDALLMMNELSREGKKLRTDIGKVESTAACRISNGDPSVSKVYKEWNKVLGVNYESIFRPAKTALPREAISFGDMSPAFLNLFDAVEEIEAARLGKIANVGGEIFARVMDARQRKNTASFYTKPQVAEFLAALTLPSEEVLPSEWKGWKIADFACGTGSLLRAGYRRLIHFASRKGIKSAKFHEYMMENNLCGLDVSAIAAHLSATTIVNLFPSVPYKSMQIGKVSFGIEEGQTYAGSLELSEKTSGNKLFDEHFTSLKGEESGESLSRIDAPDKTFAAVIMNPPYSRTGYGKAVADLSGVSDEDRGKIQKRISQLRKKTLGNGKAGLASDFLSLASQKLAEGGRLGFVLPLTIAAAGSYGLVRQHLLEEFSDITLVFFSKGVHSGGESLSDDTAMEEITLTATKGKSGRGGIKYVKLDKPFSSASIAVEAARQIWQAEQDVIEGQTKGVLYVGRDRIGEWLLSDAQSYVWSLAGSDDLHGFSSNAEFLSNGNIVAVKTSFPVTELGKLLSVGLTSDSIGYLARVKRNGSVREGSKRGAFKMHEISSKSDLSKSDLSLWHAKHDECVAVNVLPTHYGTEYDKKKVSKIRGQKTDLFIQYMMRWTSQKTLAARTQSPCLGGVSWCSLSHKDTAIKQAITIWLNSIFGFVSFWSQSQRQQHGRSIIASDAMSHLLVPDFKNKEMHTRVQSVLRNVDTENLFSSTLDRANLCISDTHRQKFNKIASDLLGIPEEKQDGVIDYLQGSWVKEPSVTPY